MRRGFICLLITNIFAAVTGELSTQDHKRFLKVDKWNITYSHKIRLPEVYPEDTGDWNVRLHDPDNA